MSWEMKMEDYQATQEATREFDQRVAEAVAAHPEQSKKGTQDMLLADRFKAYGISQREIAKGMLCSQSRINRVLNGLGMNPEIYDCEFYELKQQLDDEEEYAQR